MSSKEESSHTLHRYFSISSLLSLHIVSPKETFRHVHSKSLVAMQTSLVDSQGFATFLVSIFLFLYCFHSVQSSLKYIQTRVLKVICNHASSNWEAQTVFLRINSKSNSFLYINLSSLIFHKYCHYLTQFPMIVSARNLDEMGRYLIFLPFHDRSWV